MVTMGFCLQGIMRMLTVSDSLECSDPLNYEVD